MIFLSKKILNYYKSSKKSRDLNNTLRVYNSKDYIVNIKNSTLVYILSISSTLCLLHY